MKINKWYQRYRDDIHAYAFKKSNRKILIITDEFHKHLRDKKSTKPFYFNYKLDKEGMALIKELKDFMPDYAIQEIDRNARKKFIDEISRKYKSDNMFLQEWYERLSIDQQQAVLDLLDIIKYRKKYNADSDEVQEIYNRFKKQKRRLELDGFIKLHIITKDNNL